MCEKLSELLGGIDKRIFPISLQYIWLLIQLEINYVITAGVF